MIDNFTRRAFVERVIDGDTLVLSVALGLNVTQEGVVVRLSGINTPEIRGIEKEKGEIVKLYVVSLIEKNETFVQFQDWKKDTFGRWLVKVFCKIPGSSHTELNAHLVQMGYAAPSSPH